MAWSLRTVPELTDKQFDQWTKLLEERAGIALSDQQRVFLQTQVSMRMRELGHEDYGQYYHRVVDGLAGMVEWSVLLDRLVVKETSFFRHQPSIDFVINQLQHRINNRRLKDSFELWSVGCSTGEEPYSLGMVVNDCFELAVLEPYYGITATDISRAALNTAREGIYDSRKLERMPTHFEKRYFDKTAEEKLQVKASLKDRICFSQGNVLNIAEMPEVSMDVIYCQNLLVYFRRWLRWEIMDAFAQRLKPGGILVIGLGEVVDWVHDDVERVNIEDVQAYIRK